MAILPALATQFQSLFPATDHGQERWRWFLLTLQAILVPITAGRTSNLRRAIANLFGVEIAQSRYYTFMASVKLAWEPVWAILWRAIPDPLTAGRLLLAVDDSINPKTGRKVFACQETFDHRMLFLTSSEDLLNVRRLVHGTGRSRAPGSVMPYPHTHPHKGIRLLY